MNLAQARAKIPELNGLDDQSAFDLIHQTYYPGWDAGYLAQQLGYSPPEPEVKQAGVLRTLGDVGIKLGQGAVDLGSSVVGLGSLATGGLIGKGMRAIGYDPHATNQILGEYLSDSQKAADAKMQQADGFVNSVAAAVNNPRAILGSVAESAPGMLAGMGLTGAVARGIAGKAALMTMEGAAASAAELAAGKTAQMATKAALATQAGGAAGSEAVEAAGAKLLGISAASEGAQSAGQIADDAQAAGRSYSDYALPALAAGAITGSIAYGAGRMMGDAATEMATGARSTGVSGSMLKRAGKEFLSEGVLEEMPQSAQEQYFTNIAQGEPDTMKGVGNAAGTGLITGGVMGVGMGAMQHHHPASAPAVQLPGTGPLSQAANAGQAAAAQIAANNGIPYQKTPLPATAAAAPALALQSYPEGGIDFDPQPDARGAHQRTPIAPVTELGQSTQAVPNYANGIEFTPPTQQVSDDNILNFSERQAPIPLRHAQALVAAGKGKQLDLQVVPHAGGDGYIVVPTTWLSQQDRTEYAPLQQRTSLPAPSGSFGQMNELADLAQSERTEIGRQRDGVLIAQQAAAKARSHAEDAELAAKAQQEGEQEQEQERRVSERLQQQQEPITNAIVEHDLQTRAETNRTALRTDILDDRAIAPAHKKTAFEYALQQAGYTDTNLTPDDHHAIDAATVPSKSAPNELIDAVPERLPMVPAAAKNNLKAVDDAIAAGMRLKNHSGAVLHKKGSSKLFRLSQAQKAYYLQKMAPQGPAVTAETTPVVPPVAAPIAEIEAASPAVASATLAQDHPVLPLPERAQPPPPVEKATAPADNAVNAPAPIPTKVALNRLTTKDMSDAQLQQAAQVLADSPRANKIQQAPNERGLSTTPEAVAALPTPILDPAPQHIEAGHSEPATPSAISASIQKSAANTPMNVVQAKAALLAQIDAAIAQADHTVLSQDVLDELAAAQLALKAAFNDKKTPRGLLAALEVRMVKAQQAATMKTFDVPGDGKFTVRNSKAKLMDFRKRVMASPGFKTGAKSASKPATGPSNSPGIVISQMLADGEKVAAHTLAQLIGKPFAYGFSQSGVPNVYLEVQALELGEGIKAFVGRQVPSATNLKAAPFVLWRVIEQSTGKSFGLSGTTRDSALASARQLVFDTPIERLQAVIANTQGSTQSEMDAAWLAQAEQSEHDAERRNGWQSGDRESEDKPISRQRQVEPQVSAAAEVHAQPTLESAAPAAMATPAANLEPAATPNSADPASSQDMTKVKQALNRKTTKDMSDAELLLARELLADGPRVAKINKEMALRGIAPLQTTPQTNIPTQPAITAVESVVKPQKPRKIDPDPIPKEDTHEHRYPEPDTKSPPALADLATEDERGIGGSGRIRGDDSSRSDPSAQSDSGIDAEAALSSPRSGGSGVTTVHPAGAGTAGRGRLGSNRAGGEGSGISGSDGRTGGTGREAPAGNRRRTRPIQPGIESGAPGSSESTGNHAFSASNPATVSEAAPLASAPNLPAINFRITDALRLGQGGEVAKFNDNLVAIHTLHAIERENRRASGEEQAILARYVGWGGLANAFPAPDSGVFKTNWEQRGPLLAELLTPKEYAQARRSTLDAHYTSQTVVDAMWQAAQRLGFTGGVALEPALGSGNFIGLLPSALHGHTRFVGIELDGLTARIASQLYPNETVLHSGLQKVPLADGAFDLAIGNPPFGDQSLRFQFKPEFNGQSIHNQFFLASLDALKPGGLQVQVVSRYLLDRLDASARIMLAKKARLLGAIRLPDTAFKENARTEVVTDIVFLQRLTSAEEDDMEAGFDAVRAKPFVNREQEDERQRLAARVPDWINTTQVADPLGGERIEVNRYFAANPHMILGVLERSGSMQFKNDVTVRLDREHRLSDYLAGAIARLPQDVATRAPSVIEASLARFADMSESLRMALAGDEAGAISLAPGNALLQVTERETPEGGYELKKRTLLPSSPWSERLFQDANGHWFVTEVVTDAEGKSVKEINNGKASNRNVMARRVFAMEEEIPSNLLLGAARYERLQKLVGLRDLLVEQLAREADNVSIEAIEENRVLLKHTYEAFIKAHGLINDSANAALVSNMPDGALVLALEFSYRPAISPARAAKVGEPARASSVTPAPILSRRVLQPYIAPTSAQSLADGLSITLAEAGQVDMERLAGLLGQSVPELEQSLRIESNPLLFQDPESARWETRNDYLSGQVRRKLNAAHAAGLNANVAALEAVQPEAWTAENVTTLLGSTWVPASVYQDFIQHISGAQSQVVFSQLNNHFLVRMKTEAQAVKEEEWGADGYSASKLVIDLLNNKQIKLTSRTEDGKTVIDRERTDLALLKARAISKEFSDWVFQDTDRRNQLVEIFNEKYNTRVNRQYDGSHLVLPGKVPDGVIAMRRHQKNAIWRGIFERYLLLDHAVGAGKTFTAIAIAMERRRMGLAKKPLIIVPNHMVEQFTSDAYRLYPGAKVLAASKTDFDKKRRRKLFAKIATGDADLIIVAHSSFEFIGIAPETEERFLQEELDQAVQAVQEAQDAADASGQGESFRKPFGVKEAERLVERISTRLDRIKSNKDKLLTFEQMGVDHLIVDEAHEFKNLFYSSRMTGVKGMGNKLGSQKALDLYNKVRVLRESPTGAVTFMTGTPISNSAVEMYTMMRYLAAKELQELGLEHFDAWRAQFVSADSGWEPTETGRLKEVVRLGRTWSNMRSLMDLYYSFTDSVDNDAIKQAYAEDNHGAPFPIPRVKDGERQSVVMQPTAAQIELLGSIMRGFDGLESIKDPYERNIARLKLMDKARKVSLDVRAVDRTNTSAEQGGKLDVLAGNVARLYHQWTADRGTQLVFLDRSVPKSKGDDAVLKDYDAALAEQNRAVIKGDDAALLKLADRLERFDANEMEALRHSKSGGWNAYQQIKDNLVARGVPANEIRFVQEASNDTQKQALFDAVNDGLVRVLIGSTPRMGAGTNVQKRLVGLHHADVTWKPSDIEQREGRIIRQGNLLLEQYGVDQFEVEILAYATERTIDAKMWSLNASKLKTINGIRKYDGSFVMEFEDEESVSMAELAALASGDPLLLERVKLMSEVDKLELLKREFARKQWGMQDQYDRAERDSRFLPGTIAQAQGDQSLMQERFAQLRQSVATRQVVVDGKVYQVRQEAQQAILAAIRQQQAGDDDAKFTVSIGKRRLTSIDGALGALADALGDVEPFALQVGKQVLIGRTDAARTLSAPMSEAATMLDKGESETIAVGKLLGLSLEATLDRSDYGFYSATLAVLREDGSTLESSPTSRTDKPEFQTSAVRKALEGIMDGSAAKQVGNGIERMQQRLADAQQQLPVLKLKKAGIFPEQAALDAKYDRLEDVIRLLSDSIVPGAQSANASVLGSAGVLQSALLDHVLFADVASGASAAALLQRIAGRSLSSENRALANQLLATGIQPSVLFSRTRPNHFQVERAASDFAASYSLAQNRVTLYQMAGAEQSLLHELMHAATAQAVRAKGPAAMRMRALLADVKRSGQLTGSYGLENLDEFVAEAFTNPEFQAGLRQIQTTGRFANLWQRFVDLVRRALGFDVSQHDALARALTLGQDLMRENQALPETKVQQDNSESANDAFAHNEPAILYRRLGDVLSDAANNIAEVRLPAGYLLGDLFNQSGQLSWWHKTIGTMDNLAKRQPAFATVYAAVQGFIGDVSRYATVAADQAPTLLPKLENISDIVGAQRKKPLTALDTKAIGAPIFEGTLTWARDAQGQPVKLLELEQRAAQLSTDDKAAILLQHGAIDHGQNKVWKKQSPESYTALINREYEHAFLKAGVVWSDVELQTLFALNPAQIGLYHEFRAAIDASITNLSISEMVKLGGKDARHLLVPAMAAASLSDAAQLLNRYFTEQAKADPDRAKRYLATAQHIADLAKRGQAMMDRGYAPLSRFGRYTVYVQEGNQQLYFGMFESQADAGKMARKMRSDFPQAKVTHGTVSDEAYKLFAGVSPETIELFGSMVGLDSQADSASAEVYQTYLQLAKSNRSALKRLIERKGIAGFSEDAGRVLAGFIYSNARLTAGNAHLGDIDEAVSAIPKQQGELMDTAMQLREHIRNPQAGTQLGGLMFAQFLGGSVASAMVNLTQPLTMTLPYLSQFGGIAKASQRLLAAVRDARKTSTGDAALDAALQWATEEGIVAPQEVHYLQAQAAGKGALQSGDGSRVGDARAGLNNALSKVMVGWGKLFAMAELSNRRITFIAAYRTAVLEGMPKPADFAREAVSQTQGVYNSGNKPRWARGSLGGLALTFKQYSIAYIELLSRMAFAGQPGSPERAAGRRGALYMLAVLFLMSGADGLPFEKNLEDAIDGALQRLGYNFSSKRKKQAFLTEVLGEGGADFAIKGMSSLPGMPVDVAGRFGMGNLIPATGLLTKKQSYTSDLGELAGPAGDLAKRAFTGGGKLLGGDVLGATLDLSPQSVRNLQKGADMLQTGLYKDPRGYNINAVTPVEGIMKMVGFQPNSTANIQDAKGQALNMIAQTRMRSSEIQEHLAQGIANGDVDMQRESRLWRDDWNDKNPETRITINMPAVVKRVRAMRQDALQRTQNTAPKALKLSVRNELREVRN